MLKRQEGYILKHIDDKTYLLPYGQKIADLQKGILLNDTGAFIWNALEHPQDISTLQDLLISHYAPESTIETQIREDVSQFIKQLLQLGILREELHRLIKPCKLQTALFAFTDLLRFSLNNLHLFTCRRKSLPNVMVLAKVPLKQSVPIWILKLS